MSSPVVPVSVSLASATPGASSRISLALSCASLTVLVVLAVVAVRWDRSPVEPLPANAPPDQFSAGRALAHVERLAIAPRPTGTAANEAARHYLMHELRALGLEVQEQTSTVTRRVGGGSGKGPVAAAMVSNVMARLPGSNEGVDSSAVLLMAHYDSVPWSPGAGDDGSGVAAVMETARALENGPALAHDVLFLLTDGEEGGLWGAHAFVDQHPWAERVGIALNVDARGSNGPSLMFRTGAANLWSARALRRAVPAPRATSLTYELFRLLPNDTDLAVLTQAGIEGMDFAFIGNHPRYHSARDTADRLDLVSLQHQGSYLLGLARDLGNRDLDSLPDDPGTYFTVPGFPMVVYPSSWAIPLAVAALALWLGLVFLAVRREDLSLGRLVGAVGALVLTSSASALVTFFAWQQLTMADGDFGWLPRGLSYEDPIYSAALVLVAAAVALGLLSFFVRALGSSAVVAGGALLWLLVAGASAWKMPGLSYFFLWPAVCVMAGLTLQWLLKNNWWWWGVGTVAAVPAVVLCVPTAPTLLEGLGLGAVAALAVLLTLFLGLLAGLFEPWCKQVPWLLPASALVAALVLGGKPFTTSPFDEDHPRATSLFYCLDHSSGEASWGSVDHALDDWTRAYLGDGTGGRDLPICMDGMRRQGTDLSAPAPVLDLSPPSIDLVSRELRDDGTYSVTVRLRSNRGAAVLALGADSLAPIQEIRINGRSEGLGGQPLAGGGEMEWVLRYQGPADEPVEVAMLLREEHPLELRLVDRTWGLPDLGSAARGPDRPADTMPRPNFWPSDTASVSTRAFF